MHPLASIAIAIATAALLALPGAPQPQPATASPAPDARAPTTTVVVRAGQGLRPVADGLLGVNHHYDLNGRWIWDASTDDLVKGLATKIRRSGVRALRFPGGTVANLYDWKRAVTEPRGCQVDGQHEHLPGHEALTRGLAFGPDEYMRVVERLGLRSLVMVPWVNETAADAADWVEYMNSPAHVPGNPNGGVDYADLRAANGHPRPYRVRRWEIGNEQYHVTSRYWMSRDSATAVRQYAFGGHADVVEERLGKDCDHRRPGVASDGAPDQVFEAHYPPLAPSSVEVTVDGATWQRVSALSAAGPAQRAFVVQARTGRILFGDGVHGAVPPQGAVVRASYRSVHDGFFEFARRMRAVDPRIKVCSTWGDHLFPELVGRRSYDCLTRHVITPLSGRAAGVWEAPVEGHDRLMLGAADRRAGTLSLRSKLPPAVPLWITEVSALDGDQETWPSWMASMSNAVFSATLWGDWLELGIPWVFGEDLVWADRGVIGARPEYTTTALSLVRRVLVPMMSGRGRVVATAVRGNPVRTAPEVGESYPGLAVTAVRAPDGDVRLLAVNRLPHDAVATRVELSGFRPRDTATLRTVAGEGFMSWNRPGDPPDVSVRVRQRSVRAGALTITLPAASVTVIHVPSR